MGGDACTKVEEQDEEGRPVLDEHGKAVVRYRALSDIAVFRRVGVAPARVELRVRRLRQYQRWIRYPERHPQEIGAIFGQLPLEAHPTLCEQGFLHDSANAYATRFASDVLILIQRSEAELLESWLFTGPSAEPRMRLCVRALFMDGDLREQLLALGPGLLRAGTKTVAIPPPAGLYGPPPEIREGALEVPPPPVATWTCDLLNDDGTVCGHTFHTNRALLAHQRCAKGGGALVQISRAHHHRY
eukprot:81164-Pyramimonas_sp.AAC.1